MSNAKKIAQTFNGTVEWSVHGAYFKLLKSVTEIDVELILGGRQIAIATGVEGGFYARAPFDVVRITTPSSQEVAFFYGPAEGGSDRFTGEVVASNLYADALTNVGAVVVGAAAVAVVAADPARKALYVRARTGNTADIVLGAAGVISTGGAIRLAAGAERVIEIAAPAAWFAISTAAGQNLDVLTAA